MITLRNTGNSIKFIFSGNTMYLNDGEIEAPYNSLTLITDESGMATFRRIDGDIFISAKYEEFGMTKTQLEAWFKNNACTSGSGGGGGGGGMTPYEVQTMIDESISGKAEYSYVNNAVSGKVDTSTFTAYTAATDAALEGKVDEAYVTSAVSGKVDTTTFNIYTAATDTALSNKASASAVTAEIEAAVSGKADTTAVTAAINAAVSGKVDTTTYTAFTAATDTALNGKASSGDVAPLFGAVAYDSNTKRINFYHTSEGSVLAYVDASDFIKDGMVNNVEIKDVTLSGESVTCLVVSFNTDAGLEDINIPISNIFNANNYYTKAQIDTAMGGKVNTNAIVTAITSGATDSQVPSAKAVYDRFDEDESVTARALIDLEENKADASALTQAMTAVTAEINAAVSGKADTSAVTAIADSLSGYVETSDVTSAVTSGSTDVITSGGVYAQMGGLKLRKMTQSEYDNLQNYDNNTMYVIV